MDKTLVAAALAAFTTTVFQNATAQAAGAVDAAVALIRGEAGATEVRVPFERATRKNMADYAARN